MSTDPIASYRSILKIRRKAFRRGAIFTGLFFLFAIVVTTILLYLVDWDARSIYLMAIFVLLNSIGFTRALLRLEITEGNMELLDQIQPRKP